MNLGIVGCGVIGQQRARHLGNARLVHCVDLELARAVRIASQHDACEAGTEWRRLIERPDVDAVIVATTPEAQASITEAAIRAGRHVLVEKPAARRAEELRRLPQLALEHGVRVRVGFNHRFHRAVRQARQLIDEGALGPLLYLRARYGHGGRLGYEREWRAQPDRSGGGELIDQGVHLIDLARWFLGEFVHARGCTPTYFWNMPVEDNGFMILETAAGQVAFMHVSCTEWKNTFSLELFGRDGKLEISGLGGSYGIECLTWYRMRPRLGLPDTMTWAFPADDDSWGLEMAAFLEDIRGGREPQAGLEDALAALELVGRLYEDGQR